MTAIEQLAEIAEDLIDVLHLLTKELEKLINHVEQTTDRLTYTSQIPLVASELSGLHQRIQKLRKENT